MNTKYNYKWWLLVLVFAVVIFSCTTTKKYRRIPRDYCIDIYMDTMWLYEGGRYVGRTTLSRCGDLDSMILKDNQ